MTVATKVARAIAHLKSAQASFESFSLETQDKSAKHMYQDAAKATESLAQSLEQRLENIQDEEPEFKSNL